MKINNDRNVQPFFMSSRHLSISRQSFSMCHHKLASSICHFLSKAPKNHSTFFFCNFTISYHTSCGQIFVPINTLAQNLFPMRSSIDQGHTAYVLINARKNGPHKRVVYYPFLSLQEYLIFLKF